MIEYLCKRLIVEKGYAFLAQQTPAGEWEVPGIDPARFPFDLPVDDVPELAPLRPYFDIILFRQTSISFGVICLKEHRGQFEMICVPSEEELQEEEQEEQPESNAEAPEETQEEETPPEERSTGAEEEADEQKEEPQETAITLKDPPPHNEKSSTPITQAELVEIGQACLDYSNVVAYGQVSPVTIEVWEIFENGPKEKDKERLKALRRLAGQKKVTISAWAIDKSTQKIWSSYAPLGGRLFRLGYYLYVKQIVAEAPDFEDQQLFQEKKRGGIQVRPMAVGVTSGLVIAAGLRALTTYMQWPHPYPFDLVVVSSIPIMIAILLRRFRVNNQAQGGIAGGLFGLAYYGLMAFLMHQEFSMITFFNIGGFIVWGTFLGSVTEP